MQVSILTLVFASWALIGSIGTATFFGLFAWQAVENEYNVHDCARNTLTVPTPNQQVVESDDCEHNSCVSCLDKYSDYLNASEYCASYGSNQEEGLSHAVNLSDDKQVEIIAKLQRLTNVDNQTQRNKEFRQLCTHKFDNFHMEYFNVVPRSKDAFIIGNCFNHKIGNFTFVAVSGSDNLGDFILDALLAPAKFCNQELAVPIGFIKYFKAFRKKLSTTIFSSKSWSPVFRQLPTTIISGHSLGATSAHLLSYCPGFFRYLLPNTSQAQVVAVGFGTPRYAYDFEGFNASNFGEINNTFGNVKRATYCNADDNGNTDIVCNVLPPLNLYRNNYSLRVPGFNRSKDDNIVEMVPLFDFRLLNKIASKILSGVLRLEDHMGDQNIIQFNDKYFYRLVHMESTFRTRFSRSENETYISSGVCSNFTEIDDTDAQGCLGCQFKFISPPHQRDIRFCPLDAKYHGKYLGVQF